MTATPPLLHQIFLVVVFGRIERVLRNDLGDDGLIPDTGLVERFLGFLGLRQLLFGVIEDSGAILRSDVRSLPVFRRRVVILPENIEKLFVGDFCRIKNNLHNFGMPRAIGAYHFVCRVLHRPAAVTDGRFENARRRAKGLLHAPEAPGAEGGGFAFFRHAANIH